MLQTLHGVALRIREIGAAGQGAEAARRIRTMNIIAALACVLTLGYCAFYAAYDARLFRQEISFLLVMGPLYASVLLTNRLQWIEASMWLLIALALTHLGVVNWMLGPRSGALAYLLAIPFIVTLLIREGDWFSIWPVAVAVSLIFLAVSFSGREGSFGALSPMAQRALFFINVTGAVVLASIISLFFRWLIARAEQDLRAEKARGDRLLRAILPESVAERLKEDESSIIAEQCSNATVLLADIVGFTQRSARVSADRLVAELNQVFSRIDELAVARGVERIKTMGDGYLAVCGLPDAVPDHQARMADFALDLKEATADLAAKAWPDLQFRTVIHTGPMVAGVIGRTKFAYDVWGDTVNTVARMEEICAPGQILVTDPVCAGLPARFEVDAPKRVSLRDRGDTTMRRLMGREPGGGSDGC